MEFEYFCFLQQSRARIRTVNCPFSSGQIKARIGTVNCPYSTGAPLTPGVVEPEEAAPPRTPGAAAPRTPGPWHRDS